MIAKEGCCVQTKTKVCPLKVEKESEPFKACKNFTCKLSRGINGKKKAKKNPEYREYEALASKVLS